MNIAQRTIYTLEFDKVCEILSGFAKFEQSRNLCVALKPYKYADEIKKQIEFTREAKKILDFAKDTPTEFIANVKKN